MADWKEFTDKSVDAALTQALMELGVTSDRIEYEILEKESSGLLGLFSKPARIRVCVKEEDLQEVATSFLSKVFAAMDMEVNIEIEFDQEEEVMNINLTGDEMGILIGKRGVTLDSLQYLTSLAVNKKSESYVKVKLDTEDYRERRKQTLENLAKNIAHKVKRIHRPVYLEPMNPYERRIIHASLQDDKYVETHSEGEEPYRKVVITLKPGVDVGYENKGKRSGKYHKYNSYRKKNYYDRDARYDKKESVESMTSESEENTLE